MDETEREPKAQTDAASHTELPAEDTAKPAPMTIAEFLEGIGSSQTVEISDLYIVRRNSVTGQITGYELNTPQLFLHCADSKCNGNRIFRFEGDTIYFNKEILSTFVNYLCSNCQRTRKRYALYLKRTDKGPGSAYKYGEVPAFGPQTPARLLRLFGKDRDTFLKGRQCEIHGLGIGAFTYYRRVVESHKDQIIDEIIRVAQKVHAPPETITALESAKAEIQFSKGVKSFKPAIPQSLLIDGHNPITLLHNALSNGVHELTDADCLQLAHDVRVVLIDLAERISQALSDQAELKSAVSRLLNATRDS